MFLTHTGAAVAKEATDVWLWCDREALHLKARCHTVAMERVQKLAARPTPYARDEWGDDALELQLDVGRTRSTHGHFILPPNGKAITFTAQHGWQQQGWHPPFNYRVTLESDAWVVEATIPFASLGRVPVAGEIWGGNLLRVNPSEPTGYVQWSPTLGDALRTEFFGDFQFAGTPGDRDHEVAEYARHAAELNQFFLTTINSVQEADALRELGVRDWETWGKYLAERSGPLPLRWDDAEFGKAGIPEREHSLVLAMANSMVEKIAGWKLDPPEPTALSIERMETLGDAFLLTGELRYVDAFEQGLRVHHRLLQQTTAGITNPEPKLPYHRNPYYDAQIVRAEMLAYAYLTMRRAGLSPETHAIMMTDVILRGGRWAAFSISRHFTFGNHQVYESGGLAAVAALFPELPESADWARIASRSIRIHLDREVCPDGGWRERCGYHTVALSFVMQAIATIRLNQIEARFPELMSPETLRIFERMHEWIVNIVAPDGTMPAFGDYAPFCQFRVLQRGAKLFGNIVPPQQSVALESQFTVLRDDNFYMAVDHGPLGGQHSHVDTLGFVAYAHGKPVALDTGIGRSYSDPGYKTWYRHPRAHNIIVIDEVEPEKVAERTFWQPGEHMDIVGMRSRAYEHCLGAVQDRVIYFLKGAGWLIHDRVTASAAQHHIDWMLHTPYELSPEAPGLLSADGLLIVAGRAEELEAPVLEKKPAALPNPAATTLRAWDKDWQSTNIMSDITSLRWRKKPIAGKECEFVTVLLPYRGTRPTLELRPSGDGWELKVGNKSWRCRTAGGGA